MIYVVKIPAILFATLRTSIGKPQKMSGQWQWQVAVAVAVASGKWQVSSGIRLPVAPLPSIAITLPPALSHPGRAAFLMRSGQTLLPARSHSGRGRPRRFLE